MKNLSDVVDNKAAKNTKVTKLVKKIPKYVDKKYQTQVV